jgi:hypothetical protein
MPHPGQVTVGRELFNGGKRRVFVRCGRKWGKTDFEIYALHRWGMLIPEAQFYYVAPYYNQAAEIIWHSGRLPNFLKQFKEKYIKKIYNDKRIVFYNDSFIKLVGSDNFEAGRGFNPDGGVYDEFKDHDPRFDEGFRPNLIAKKAPLLIVGTPPDNEDHFFCRTEEEFKQHPSGIWMQQTTYNNPYIDKDELEVEKQGYVRRGEWAVWMREYMAEIVPGGANAIFPMFEAPIPSQKITHTKHVRPKEELHGLVQRSYKDWDFYAIFDPGSVACFAGIFFAVNKFTKQVAILAEIYETDKSKTSTKQIYPQAQFIMSSTITGPIEWDQRYDYAAAWFQVEVQNEYGVNLLPCSKDLNDKENKLSVIKDFFLEELILISDNCVSTIKELSLYSTDEHGRIPKKNDHTIDCLRYGFNAAGLFTLPKNRRVRAEDKRMWTQEDEEIFEDEESDLDLLGYKEFEEDLYGDGDDYY